MGGPSCNLSIIKKHVLFFVSNYFFNMFCLISVLRNDLVAVSELTITAKRLKCKWV